MLNTSKRVKSWLLSERRRKRRNNPTPPPPGNLQISTGETSLFLTWDEPEADEYDVLRAEADNPLRQTLLATVEVKEYEDETPVVGTLYTYTVHARTGGKTGPPTTQQGIIPEPE